MSTTAHARREGRFEVRSSTRCLDHRPGLGHPDQPIRLDAVLRALKPGDDCGWLLLADSPLPDEEQTLGVAKWVHADDYIERFREACRAGGGWLDTHDCVVSNGTFAAATAAVGLALQAALDLVNRKVDRVFLAARPPAHHAERARAKGYCYLNSVAVAAEVIVRSWNAPVLIVDFDALHGNGTQQHFWERADVGYLSVHRYPGFPGSGGGDEIGGGAGLGATRNIPLAAGADDAIFCTAFENGIAQMAAQLQPAALVVSAGFNGHHADVTGGLGLTAAGYRRLTRAVMAAANRWAEGRVVSFLEGGYAVEPLAECARAHVEEMACPDRVSSDGSFPVN